jgi:hypothetical protein
LSHLKTLRMGHNELEFTSQLSQKGFPSPNSTRHEIL